MYGSTEALTADVKWILHNCIVYNGSKLLPPDGLFCAQCNVACKKETVLTTHGFGKSGVK
jgi:hypothetical protein